MSRRNVVCTGVLAILVVGAVSGAALAKPLSDQKWRKAASSVCEQFHSDRTAILPASGLNVVTPQQALPYVEEAVPLYEGLITSIDALDEPKARKKQVKAFLGALTESVATIEANPLAAFSAFDDPFDKANRAAKKLRLEACRGLGDQRL